jgi:hypothetical protein
MRQGDASRAGLAGFLHSEDVSAKEWAILPVLRFRPKAVRLIKRSRGPSRRAGHGGIVGYETKR